MEPSDEPKAQLRELLLTLPEDWLARYERRLLRRRIMNRFVVRRR